MNPSPPKPVWTIAAVAGTAALYTFGFALDPVPWLVWLAPLPLLWLAPRSGPWTTAAVAAGAWTLGGLRMLWYFHDTIEIPIPAVLAIAATTAAGFAGCVSLFRALVLRRRHTLAAFGFASAWVSVEFVLAVLNRETAGNWYSISYTQTDLTPILQTASIAGVAGIAFVVSLVPAAVAAALAPGSGRSSRAWVLGTTAVLLVAALGFGFVRPRSGSEPVTVAALAYERDQGWITVGEPKAQDVFDRYRDGVVELAQDGVNTVVLPEKLVRVPEAERTEYFEKWRVVAHDNGINVVLGMALDEGEHTTNAAVWFPAEGDETAIYRKNFLIPGLENHLTAADDLGFAPGHDSWGLAICKDLDFADFAARYGDRGATILFAPAWDFDVDGWWHSRVAVTRGVEQGFALVRTGDTGRMTVSDANGRVLADDAEVAVATVGTNGASTVYARFGDWLVWLCLASTVLASAFALRRRPIVTR